MGNPLDLVLINPASRSQVYQTLGTHLAAVEPPVWAGMIATFARGKGFSVHVIDAEAEELCPEDVAAQVEMLKPALAAVVVYGHQPSASTQIMPAAGAVCRSVKARSPEQPVLLLGGHVAALPERTLCEEAADFASRDEGLYTTLDLLRALKSGSGSDLARVRGLVWRDGEVLRSNPAAALLQDLDGEMSGVAWDLLPMARYRAHNWHCFGNLPRQPYAALYTSLGCPYRCSFCCIQAPFKAAEESSGLKAGVNSYRCWSPETVMAQIDTLVQRYGVRNIKIADEMFVLNPKHVAGICDALIERGYPLNLWAYARVDTVRDAQLDRLRRAGFTWLALGIEAASPRVRNAVQKGYPQERIFRTVRAIQAAGIRVIGNFIFGLPEDDLETMQETLELARALQCEFVNFYATMAYPGSSLYQRALERNWPLPESWSGYSQHAIDTLPLATRTLSGAEVLQFRDQAFRAYFTDPAYHATLARAFGPETVRQVQEMAAHKLTRKCA